MVPQRKYFISNDILEQTSRCENGFSCLKVDGDQFLCQVLASYDDDVHFIGCKHTQDCVYKARINERCHCECPVRKELFRKYKI